MESSPVQCLLCLGNCSPQKEEEETPFSLLGGQLKAVFVLRELLRLPPEKLSGFLERIGGANPHEWIRFCDLCQALVEEAFSLFEEQVKIHRKFKRVQQEMVNNVRESQIGGDRAKDAIAQETRRFVNNHDYGPFESRFLVGDWEAEWRVEQQKVDFVLKKEMEEPEDLQNDDLSSFPEGDFHLESDSEPEEKPVKKEKRRPAKKRRIRSQQQPRELQPGSILPTERLLTDSGTPLFRCSLPNCGKVLQNRHAFHSHKRRHSQPPPPVKSFPCPHCPLTFPHFQKRVKHLRLSHPPAIPPPPPPKRKQKPHAKLQCPHCPHTAVKMWLESHIKRVHEGQPAFRCEHCGHGVCSRRELHLHQADKHFICGVKGCALRLENREELHAHQVGVHGREAHVSRCDLCGKYFSGAGKLKRHKQQAHGKGGPETHICERCGKGFRHAEYLYHHVRNAHKK